MLTADYYEKTDTLDILGIQKLDDNTTVETIYEEPIIGKGLRVNRIIGESTGGYSLRVQGTVENIGCVPLENVIIEVKTFDVNDNWVRTDNTTLTPSKINVYENAKFLLEIEQMLAGKEVREGGRSILGRYTYRFLLPSEEELYIEYPE
ncbi:FxLYD domain-containing protein [Chloroflexota bacterium]